MKRKLLTFGAIGAFGLTAFLGAQAQGPGENGPGHPPFLHRGPGGLLGGNPLEHISEVLGLTPEQKASAKPIVEDAKAQILAIHKEAMDKTRAVMEAAAPKIRTLLTPEQQPKFDALQKAHQDMHKAMEEMHDAAQK